MKSRFKLEFYTDNAAFVDNNAADEMARILRKVADQVESGADFGNVRDINGNLIGEFNLYKGE